MKTSSTLRFVVKFGERKHMLTFQKKGQLYMNTLAHFNKLEKTDPLRSDDSEGLSYTKPSKGAKIKFGISGLELKSVDAIRLHHPDSENINIFSLYGITDNNLYPKRDQRLIEFGDSAVIITKGMCLTKVKSMEIIS